MTSEDQVPDLGPKWAHFPPIIELMVAIKQVLKPGTRDGSTLSIRLLAALVVLTVLPGDSLAQPRTREATTVRPHVQTKPATDRRPDDPADWSLIYNSAGRRVGLISPMRR
jgi:hypothetical protein